MAEALGMGMVFEYGDPTAVFTASTGWTKVAKVIEFTAPETEADDINVTHHDVTDYAKIFQAGLEDGGTSETTCFYDKTIYATLDGLRRTPKRFRIKYSDGSGIGWGGYIKSNTIEGDMEGALSMKIATKVSGKPVTIASIT